MGHRVLRDTGLPRSPVHQIRGMRLRVCRALASQMSAAALLGESKGHTPQTASEQQLTVVCQLILTKKKYLKNQVSLSTFPMETLSFRKQTQNQGLIKSHYFPGKSMLAEKAEGERWRLHLLTCSSISLNNLFCDSKMTQFHLTKNEREEKKTKTDQ